MSAHVKVQRHIRWWANCMDPNCPSRSLSDPILRPYPTHAEALVAAWAHIKEHSTECATCGERGIA